MTAADTSSAQSRPPRRAPRRGIKGWMPLFGLVLLLILVIGIPSAYTSRDSFCGSCHIMQPYYNSWIKSTHAKASCVSCHNDPGLTGWTAAKAALFRQVVAAVIFRPDKINDGAPVPNSNCIHCHAENRKITMQNDLKLPAGHHKMKGNPYRCVDCHKNLVHSKTPKQKNAVQMKDCVSCHKARKAPVTCETCHYNKKSK